MSKRILMKWPSYIEWKNLRDNLVEKAKAYKICIESVISINKRINIHFVYLYWAHVHRSLLTGTDCHLGKNGCWVAHGGGKLFNFNCLCVTSDSCTEKIQLLYKGSSQTGKGDDNILSKFYD